MNNTDILERIFVHLVPIHKYTYDVANLRLVCKLFRLVIDDNDLLLANILLDPTELYSQYTIKTRLSDYIHNGVLVVYHYRVYQQIRTNRINPPCVNFVLNLIERFTVRNVNIHIYSSDIHTIPQIILDKLSDKYPTMFNTFSNLQSLKDGSLDIIKKRTIAKYIDISCLIKLNGHIVICNCITPSYEQILDAELNYSHDEESMYDIDILDSSEARETRDIELFGVRPSCVDEYLNIISTLREN